MSIDDLAELNRLHTFGEWVPYDPDAANCFVLHALWSRELVSRQLIGIWCEGLRKGDKLQINERGRALVEEARSILARLYR